MTARQDALARALVNVAVEKNLKVREIILDPDGTVRVLTAANDGPVTIDPLAEARAKRAAKGERNANSD